MTDRELLIELAVFLASRAYIEGDKASIADMVQRYANPPLTLHYRAAMRLTVTEYRQLQALLERVNNHLKLAQVDTAS